MSNILNSIIKPDGQAALQAVDLWGSEYVNTSIMKRNTVK